MVKNSFEFISLGHIWPHVAGKVFPHGDLLAEHDGHVHGSTPWGDYPPCLVQNVFDMSDILKV